MAATYQKHGIAFFYPENWELSEEENDGSVDVTLRSPAGAVWSIAFFPQGRNPNEVAREALGSFTEDYEDVESVSATETVEGVTMIGYDINFILLDFVVSGAIRSFVNGGRTYCILRQAETREFDELAELHRAITFSLLTGLGADTGANSDKQLEISTNDSDD